MSGTTDYLTCGQCLKEFPLQLITLFIQHKKLDCNDDLNLQNSDPELQCNYCPQGFMTAWGLLLHAQLTHNLKIFLENASKTLLKQISVQHTPLNKPALQLTQTSKEGSYVTSYVHAESDEILATTENIATSFVSTVGTTDSTVVSAADGKSHYTAANLVEKNSPVGVGANSNDVPSLFVDKSEPDIRNSVASKGGIPLTPCRIITVPSGSNLNLSPGQKLNIYPLKQGCGTFIPKLCVPVVPVSLSSSQVSSSGIRIASAASVPSALESSFKPPVLTPNVITKLAVATSKSNSQSSASGVVNSTSSIVKLTSSVVGTSSVITQSAHSIIMPSATVADTAMLDTAVDDQILDKSEENNAMIEDKELSGSSTSVIESIDKPLVIDTGEQGEAADAASDNEMDREAPGCCDRQGCGVTVIPASHEDLQKCCNAVVPKKRKRHFEQKHMAYSWSSSRYARRKMLNRSLLSAGSRSGTSQYQTKPSAGSTIYIDLEPDLGSEDHHMSEQYPRVKVTQPGADDRSQCLSSSRPSFTSAQVSQSKPHSLILKPGAVYSIPFTYTIPTSYLDTKTLAPSITTSTNTSADRILNSSTSKDYTIDSESMPLKGHDVTADDSHSEQDTNMQAERKTHPFSKPFQCEKCTMAFNQRVHLKKHMSKHTGIKPYKCGECNYSTVERSHLKVHIRIHTGEKPFKCTYCEYATAQNSTLKIHLKRHHGGRMFQCKGCQKQFTQEEQLRGHEWEHGGTPVTSHSWQEPAIVSETILAGVARNTVSSQNSTDHSVTLTEVQYSTDSTASQNEELTEVKSSAPSSASHTDRCKENCDQGDA